MTTSADTEAYATPAAEVVINVDGDGHVDLRVRRTRAAIEAAFREMVCEMPAGAITVKGLTDRAQIHRKTFYLHYSSIEALFEDMLQTLAQRYFDEIDAISDSMPIDEINRVFFRRVARQDRFYERLMTAPEYRDFANRLFTISLQYNRERHNPYAHLGADEQNIVNTFLVSGTLDMYRQWIADGRRIPLEDMIELSSRLLESGAGSLRSDT